MKFVEKPNLPRKVKLVAIGEKYSELIKNPLNDLGIEVLTIPDNPCVDQRISGHADISVLHMGDNVFALAHYLKGSNFEKSLQNQGASVWYCAEQQDKLYPKDALMNLCILGNKVICNPLVAEKTLVQYLTSEGYEFVDIKQGYSKCNVCVLRDDLLITSDSGIHRRVEKEGIESLFISPGYIELAGFDYGFIGGAAFLLDEKTVAFTGRFDTHPDKYKILDFLGLHNIDIVYITQKPVFDIGSVIQIIEK